jgi:hypothetical protein
VSLAKDLRSDPLIRREERVAEAMEKATADLGPEEAAFRAVEQVTAKR